MIFTAAATFLLAGTFLAGSAIATGALAIGLGVAAKFGLSYAIQAITGNQNQPAAASDSFGIQGTLRAGGAVPRCFPLGRSADPGQLVYANYWGVHDKTPNAYFTQVIKLSDLPGPRLLQVWVAGELCTIDFDPAREHPYGNPLVEYRKDNEDHLWIKYYDGTQSAADSFLVTVVSSPDRPYSNKRVGFGLAYAIVTSLANETLFTGFPDCLFEMSSIPLYDPSKDSTVGGSGPQRYSDPSTWGGDGDDFPVVQGYNVLRGIRYNGAWVYGLQKSTAATLPIENWTAQIAKCRTPTAGEGGPEPTYRSGGMINVNTQPANALKAMLMACQGNISELGGFYKLRVGAPDSPTFSFTDDDILSSEPQVFRPFSALADSVNGIQATYPDPTQGWKTPATAPAYLRTDLEARDGNRRLMANPFFARVPYAAQVQRLQKSAIEEAQRARTHTVTLPPPFWIVEPGDVGAWTSARNGYVDKSFRFDAMVDKDNVDVLANITEVDPSDYDWNHGSEFRPVGSGPTNIPRPAPQGIVDWRAEPWILQDASGASRRPAIRLRWDGNMPAVVGMQYEVRLAEDESDVTKGRTDQLAAGAIIISQSLLPLEDYEARGQYLPSSPRDMLWSDWLPVTTPDVRESLVEFDDGIRDRLTAALDQLYELETRLSQARQGVARINLALAWNDKHELRREISSLTGAANARITEVFTVATNTVTALAQTQISLETELGEANSRITITNTSLSDLTQSVADQTQTFNSQFGNVSGQITSEIQTRSAADGALSLRIDDFVAQTNNSFATVSSQIVAQASSTSALAGQMTSFTTTLNGHTSQLNILAASVDGLGFEFGITGTIDGSTGAFILSGARRNDGEVSTRILMRADEVIIDGSVKTPQLDVGAVKAINIDSDTIEARHFTQNSVPLEAMIAGSATHYDRAGWAGQGIGFSGTRDVVSNFAFEISSSPLAYVTVNVDISWPSGGSILLIVDGSTVRTWQGGNYAASLSWLVDNLIDGVHHFTVRFVVNGAPSGAGTWLAGQFYVQNLRK